MGSGRADRLWAWVYLCVYAFGATLNMVVLLLRNPQVIAERGKTAGMKRWDRLVGGAWAVLFFVGLPLTAAPMMLGSGWAYLPGCLSAALMASRTYLEDRMLVRELAGYEAYASDVRYRLVPGVR